MLVTVVGQHTKREENSEKANQEQDPQPGKQSTLQEAEVPLRLESVQREAKLQEKRECSRHQSGFDGVGKKANALQQQSPEENRNKYLHRKSNSAFASRD